MNIKRLIPGVWFGKGATAWELQIGQLGVRWVHLKGGHWTHPFQPSRWSCKIHKEQSK